MIWNTYDWFFSCSIHLTTKQRFWFVALLQHLKPNKLAHFWESFIVFLSHKRVHVFGLSRSKQSIISVWNEPVNFPWLRHWKSRRSQDRILTRIKRQQTSFTRGFRNKLSYWNFSLSGNYVIKWLFVLKIEMSIFFNILQGCCHV